MRLTLLLTFGLVLGGPIWAEEPGGGTLAGRVILGEQGLPGVTITATGPVTAQAVTTLDGTYQLAGLPAGVYTLALTQDGLQGSPPVRTVILQGRAIPDLDFVASPIAPALPTVRLTPSTSLARPGDTLTLRLTLTPGSQEPVADLYLLFLPPGAPLRPQAPWQASLLVPPVADLPVASHTVTGTEPPGTYTWLAFLTRPGSTDLLGPVASVSVTVQP